MKKLLLIVGVATLVFLGIVLIVILRKSSTPTANVPSGAISFPNASSSQPGTISGTAHTFLQDADVRQDTSNPGYFYLGNQPAGEGQPTNSPYLIEYISETKYFTVTVLHEPIGQTRRAAEIYLQQKLGLSQDQMCSLAYTVGVPDYINSQYSGMNLGFSFCPGAVKLPQ